MSASSLSRLETLRRLRRSSRPPEGLAPGGGGGSGGGGGGGGTGGADVGGRTNAGGCLILFMAARNRVASARALGIPPPTLSSERAESWPLVGPWESWVRRELAQRLGKGRRRGVRLERGANRWWWDSPTARTIATGVHGGARNAQKRAQKGRR